MSTSVVGAEVRRYVESVRAQLADLAPDDREELLEDLEDHLLEVAAEDDGSLEERLGPPDIYAEELRASAGLERDDAALGLADRVRRSEIVASARGILASAQAHSMREFFRQIGPGWWVARGYLAVLAVALIHGRSTGTPIRENFPLPFQGWVLPIILTSAAVWLSFVLGRMGRRNGVARTISIAATVIVAVAIFNILDDIRTTGAYGYEDYGSSEPTQPYLHHEDGTAILNVCPYSSDGTLLSGVLLFDHQGRAIINVADSPAESGNGFTPPAILNAYPRSLVVYGESGQRVSLSCPASIGAPPTTQAPPGQPTPIPTGD